MLERSIKAIRIGSVRDISFVSLSLYLSEETTGKEAINMLTRQKKGDIPIWNPLGVVVLERKFQTDSLNGPPSLATECPNKFCMGI